MKKECSERKEKIELMKQMSFNYRKYKMQLENYEYFNSINKNKDSKAKIAGFIKVFDATLELLDAKEKELIIKEFVDNTDSNWWVEKYKKADFVKLKTQAVCNFIDYVY